MASEVPQGNRPHSPGRTQQPCDCTMNPKYRDREVSTNHCSSVSGQISTPGSNWPLVTLFFSSFHLLGLSSHQSTPASVSSLETGPNPAVLSSAAWQGQRQLQQPGTHAYSLRQRSWHPSQPDSRSSSRSGPKAVPVPLPEGSVSRHLKKPCANMATSTVLVRPGKLGTLCHPLRDPQSPGSLRGTTCGGNCRPPV